MKQPNATKPKGPRRRVSEQVVQSLAITSQMALLYPPGMTNRKIAQSLTVTAKTVETHLRHVYQKLEVAKRTELAGVLK